MGFECERSIQHMGRIFVTLVPRGYPMKFELTSEYKPTGDQPAAIQQLVSGIERQEMFQTLLGVTGSGKTFTVANVIQEDRKSVV